jgi:uncharacterized protein
MPTTSSPTSVRLSSESKPGPLVAWLSVAALFVASAFIGASSGQTDPNILYKYSFAVVSLVAYTFLLGLTLGLAIWLGRPLAVLGLRRFSWGWFWAAVGVIVAAAVLGALLEPILHAGEEQGLEPKAWDPDRAPAFVVNLTVAATIVPLAEELFFRGLGVSALLPLGGVAAVGITAFAFGLGHGILVALPVLVVFGAGLGWVRLRSGSVWPGVLAHGFYNGALLAYVYFDLT